MSQINENDTNKELVEELVQQVGEGETPASDIIDDEEEVGALVETTEIPDYASDEEIELKPELPSVHKLSEEERDKLDIQEVAKFLDDTLYPLIEQGYDKDYHPEIKRTVKILFEALYIAKKNNVPIGTFPISLDAIGQVIPLLADEIQARLDAYRPAGKQAAQKALGMMLKVRMADSVCHVNDMASAYTLLDASEEFAMFEVNPRRVSILSFRTEEGRTDRNIIPAQFKTEKVTVIMRWDDINNIILSPLVELTENGRHPDYQNILATAQNGQPLSGMGVVPGKKHLKDVDPVLGDMILQASTRSLASALKVAKQNDIDPNSITEMMSSVGYMLSEDMSMFVPIQTQMQSQAQQPPVQEQVPPAQSMPAQGQAPQLSGQQQEVSSLLSFLED